MKARRRATYCRTLQRADLNDARALPIDEQARAKRVTPESRSRFVTMRLILRSLLSQKLGRDISGVSFHYTKAEVILAERPVAFNISHSESPAYRIDLAGAVGIDLEAIHPLPDSKPWRNATGD